MAAPEGRNDAASAPAKAPGPSVRDDTENGRFVVDEDGERAELVYETEPGRLLVLHTGVPGAISQRGIGGSLVRAALERAREEGLTLVPWCSFARHWLTAHSDLASGVAIDWAAPPSVG